MRDLSWRGLLRCLLVQYWRKLMKPKLCKVPIRCFFVCNWPRCSCLKRLELVHEQLPIISLHDVYTHEECCQAVRTSCTQQCNSSCCKIQNILSRFSLCRKCPSTLHKRHQQQVVGGGKAGERGMGGYGEGHINTKTKDRLLTLLGSIVI